MCTSGFSCSGSTGLVGEAPQWLFPVNRLEPHNGSEDGRLDHKWFLLDVGFAVKATPGDPCEGKSNRNHD